MSARPSAREAGTLAPSLLAARAVLGALVTYGVRDLVLAPGSRSAPFVPVALALAQAGAVRVRVVLDERSAGFTALGIGRARLARGRRQPAAVITTSGTAVANLHPAVLEADAAGVPLLVVSADRPHEMVGTGANQTTEQTSLFGRAARAVVDLPADLTADLGCAALPVLTGQVRRAVQAATGALTNHPGPAQVNARFRPRLALPAHGPEDAWEGLGAWAQQLAEHLGEQPAVSQIDPAPPGAPRSIAVPSAQASPSTGAVGLASGPTCLDHHSDDAAGSQVSPSAIQDGLVVAGDAADGAGGVAAALAEMLGWPLLAEPTSGARAGTTALPRYAELLTTPAGQELADRADRVVVVGHPSLTRPVSALLARTDLTIDVLTTTATWTDVAGTAHSVIPLPTLDRLTPDSDQRARAVADQVIDRLLLRPARAGWLDQWRDAVARLPLAQDAASLTDPHQPLTPPAAALVVWDSCLPVGDRAQPALVVGSSMTIRHLDRLAPAGPGHQPALTLANRGLAGIDGTLATAVGAWHAWDRPVRALVGDLTFLHDAMSLGRGRLEREPDLQVIVLDDAGGAIFSTLEYPAVTPADVMDRGFSTPQVADVPALAAALGARVRTVRTVGQLRAALDGAVTGLSVIHVDLGAGER